MMTLHGPNALRNRYDRDCDLSGMKEYTSRDAD